MTAASNSADQHVLSDIVSSLRGSHGLNINLPSLNSPVDSCGPFGGGWRNVKQIQATASNRCSMDDGKQAINSSLVALNMIPLLTRIDVSIGL